MSGALRGARIGYFERPDSVSDGHLSGRLVPLLRARGAVVDVVHAETGLQRLDRRPGWDLVVLKSGSAVALHAAAAAEAWSVPCVNPVEATRLAQDRLATAAILLAAGLPVPPARLAWLGAARPPLLERGLSELSDLALVVKAARGSRGDGLWTVEPGGLTELVRGLPAGPYLLMERIPHGGDDLKVYVAGRWLAAIERPFPARTPAEKRGRPVAVPAAVAEVARRVGRRLGLSCFGCDFIAGPNGWTLVDVNAFPGYKGLDEAPEAIADELAQIARGPRARETSGRLSAGSPTATP